MTTPDDIPQLWETLTNQLVFLEKRYVFRHGELDLHPSELHLLLAIKDEPEANATKLAGRLGVTKGAVSQLLKKLEAKGVIEKTSDPAQKNEITSTFTRLGKAASIAGLRPISRRYRPPKRKPSAAFSRKCRPICPLPIKHCNAAPKSSFAFCV